MEEFRGLAEALRRLAEAQAHTEAEQQETQQVRTFAMRVTYDPQTDSLTITLRDERIKESDEVRPGVIADFGYDGGVVRFEIMQASKVIQNTREIQFAVGE